MLNIDKIYRILEKEVKKYDVPVVTFIRIQEKEPFKVLISALLSARTKDEVTTEVCRKLFKKIKKIKDFENYSIEDMEKMIYPVSFYKNKARYLKKLPAVLEKDFDEKIPKTVEGLIELPGVGRKTANLVVAEAFDNYGMCVDTHVHRISNRLGYVDTKTPYETEMALRKKLPKKYWKKWNSFLVAFGQNICRPISPFCSKCPIRKHCKRIGVKRSR